MPLFWRNEKLVSRVGTWNCHKIWERKADMALSIGKMEFIHLLNRRNDSILYSSIYLFVYLLLLLLLLLFLSLLLLCEEVCILRIANRRRKNCNHLLISTYVLGLFYVLASKKHTFICFNYWISSIYHHCHCH